MMKYVATPGALFPQEMAQAYGEYLNDALPRKLGRAPTTKDIVEDARRSPSCPYRDYFEWNQKKGHELYLEVQARNLINHIAQITIVGGERKVCRAFFPIQEVRNQPKTWVPLSRVRRDPALMEHVIQSARKELVSWNDKYSTYAAMQGASTYVQRAIQAIKEKNRKAVKS